MYVTSTAMRGSRDVDLMFAKNYFLFTSYSLSIVALLVKIAPGIRKKMMYFFIFPHLMKTVIVLCNCIVTILGT